MWNDHENCPDCACCIGLVCIQDHSPAGHCTGARHIAAWEAYQQGPKLPRQLPAWVEALRVKLRVLVVERTGIPQETLETVRELEEDAILLVLTEAMPQLLQQAMKDLHVGALRHWGHFGDQKHQDLWADRLKEGVRFTLSLAVLWPGAVQATRSTGWSTIPWTDVRALRDLLNTWLKETEQ